MLRRSISQIFESNTPHEQSLEHDCAMLPSLQPSRPKVPSYTSPPPLNQQPSRTATSVPVPPISPPTLRYLPPRNQIEAMPPVAPSPTRLALGQPQQQFLSALRHPVFFTDRFTKAPPGVQTGGSSGTPVATGYVYNDGVRRPVDGSARL